MSPGGRDRDPAGGEPPRVEAVLFDLDGTVWEYRRPGAELLALAFAEAGVEPCFDMDDYVRLIDEYVEDCHTDAELRRRTFAALTAERLGDPAAGRAVADVYSRERDYRNVRALPGIREAVATLGERYRVAAVTNNSPEAQQPKLRELDLADAFERIVYAGLETPAKPDPAPFRAALAVLDVPPGRAVHVGDLAADVAGATAAGLSSVFVGESLPDDCPSPTYVVDTPADLVDPAPPWEPGSGDEGEPGTDSGTGRAE